MVFSFHTYRGPVETEIDAYYASFDPCTQPLLTMLENMVSEAGNCSGYELKTRMIELLLYVETRFQTRTHSPDTSTTFELGGCDRAGTPVYNELTAIQAVFSFFPLLIIYVKTAQTRTGKPEMFGWYCSCQKESIVL